jgi:hypothetical protein
MLKKHLQSRHGLSVVQYKLRWNLSSDYPMTAANYSEHRSQLAKSIGFGRGPAEREALHAAAASATEKPVRRRAASKTTATRTSAKKASPKKPRKPSKATSKAAMETV